MRYRVALPPELLRREDISPTAKFLYLVAQATHPGSLAELGRAAGVERRQTARLCAHLARTGWMKLARSGRETVPVPVCPAAVEEQQAERLLKVVAMSRHKGECLMKCWLDLLVASDDFVDNARPGFLGNPLSGESLEFDRYYLDGVAFEFNGPQHYGPTASFPDEQAFREGRARDLLKKGLSREKRIELVEITADDLSLDGITAKLPALLPRSVVDRDGPYAMALERLCQEYRAKATATPWGRSTPDAKPLDTHVSPVGKGVPRLPLIPPTLPLAMAGLCRTPGLRSLPGASGRPPRQAPGNPPYHRQIHDGLEQPVNSKQHVDVVIQKATYCGASQPKCCRFKIDILAQVACVQENVTVSALPILHLGPSEYGRHHQDH